MSRRAITLHDYFGMRGGGERLALTLAHALDTDLTYGYWSEDSYERAMFPQGSRDLNLPKVFQRPGIRAAALAVRYSLERSNVARYETRIFSGIAAPFAAPKRRANARNIYYCHTPARVFYDQRESFQRNIGPLRRIAASQLQRGYERAVARMDMIIANSATVQERIRQFWHRESEIAYPPCDLDAFRDLGQQGYYLSTARLSPLKRIDRIIDAFRGMPDRNLVVASGGGDLEQLRRAAGDAPNIHFTGWIGEDQLRRLIGEAVATIYIPVDEDFGMSPVESMAAGKPVIGVAEGGLRETIVDGETGLLLRPDPTAEDLREAVIALTPQRAATMKSACQARAAMFSEARFVARMKELTGL